MVSERELTLEAIRNAVRSADACGSDTASLQKGCLQFVLGEVARGESRLSAVLEGLRKIEVELVERVNGKETRPNHPRAPYSLGWLHAGRFVKSQLAALRTVGEQRTQEEKA